MKLLSVRVQTVHNVTIINNKWKEPVFQKKKRNNEKSNNKKNEKSFDVFDCSSITSKSNSKLSRQLIFRGRNICYVIAPNYQLPFAIDSNQLPIASFVTSYLRRLKFENKKLLNSSILLLINNVLHIYHNYCFIIDFHKRISKYHFYWLKKLNIFRWNHNANK